MMICVLSCLLSRISSLFFLFFFNDPATTEIYTLSLHDALPIFLFLGWTRLGKAIRATSQSREVARMARSEEHTSELQSHHDLVCRLLLEKKKKKKYTSFMHHTTIRLSNVVNLWLNADNN